MGVVHAEIELINSVDLGMAQRCIIGEEEVRSIRVRMLVDSGAWMMCINENIQSVLQLPFIEQRTYQMANGDDATHDVVGPVSVKFANRRALCSALVLPWDTEPLLGAILMEEMDVLIHPKRQELVVNPLHPEYAVLKLGGLRPRSIRDHRCSTTGAGDKSFTSGAADEDLKRERGQFITLAPFYCIVRRLSFLLPVASGCWIVECYAAAVVWP